MILVSPSCSRRVNTFSSRLRAVPSSPESEVQDSRVALPPGAMCILAQSHPLGLQESWNQAGTCCDALSKNSSPKLYLLAQCGETENHQNEIPGAE